MDNTYTRLTRLGFLPEKEHTERTALSVAEAGKTYRVEWNGRKPSSAFPIDGHIINDGARCDKLIVVEDITDEGGWADTFVELKGRDVPHAVEQLEATLKSALFRTSRATKTRARIVSASMPSSRNSPEWERAQRRFIQAYGCELKRMKSQQPDRL